MRWAVGIARRFGVPVVVAINRFDGDTEAEIALLKEQALKAGAVACAAHTAFADGGEGVLELAELVKDAAAGPKDFRLLYEDNASIKDKINTLATTLYNARWCFLRARGGPADTALRGVGMGQPTPVPGEDPPVPLSQSFLEGGTGGVHVPHTRGARRHRGRVPLSPRRRHEHNAWPSKTDRSPQDTISTPTGKRSVYRRKVRLKWPSNDHVAGVAALPAQPPAQERSVQLPAPRPARYPPGRYRP